MTVIEISLENDSNSRFLQRPLPPVYSDKGVCSFCGLRLLSKTKTNTNTKSKTNTNTKAKTNTNTKAKESTKPMTRTRRLLELWSEAKDILFLKGTSITFTNYDEDDEDDGYGDNYSDGDDQLGGDDHSDGGDHSDGDDDSDVDD